jgi:hypothetical protein
MRIVLYKDISQGDFDTREVERVQRVESAPVEGAFYGWGSSKLGARFGPPRDRFLVMDSSDGFGHDPVWTYRSRHQG